MPLHRIKARRAKRQFENDLKAVAFLSKRDRIEMAVATAPLGIAAEPWQYTAHPGGLRDPQHRVPMDQACDADLRARSAHAKALAANSFLGPRVTGIKPEDEIGARREARKTGPGFRDYDWEVLAKNYERALSLLRVADSSIQGQRDRLLDLFRVEESDIQDAKLRARLSQRRSRVVYAVPDHNPEGAA